LFFDLFFNDNELVSTQLIYELPYKYNKLVLYDFDVWQGCIKKMGTFNTFKINLIYDKLHYDTFLWYRTIVDWLDLKLTFQDDFDKESILYYYYTKAETINSIIEELHYLDPTYYNWFGTVKWRPGILFTQLL
jgi:hypothetical protein